MGVAALLVIAFGSPLAGGRSVVAFGQHFALNYSVWHPEIPASPWMHSGTFIKHGFGREVTSLSDAFFLNPPLFIRHLSTNILNLVLITSHNLVDMLVTPWLSRLVFPGRRYVLGFLFLAIVALVNWQQTVRNAWQHMKQTGWYWLCLAVMLLSTYISCILIFPREHYILFQIPLYLSLVGIFLQSVVFRPIPVPALPWPARYAAFGAVLLIFLAPFWRADNEPKPTPTVDLLRFLQKLPVQGSISMTGNAPLMYDLYLGDNWQFWYLERYHPGNMQSFFKEFKVNCIHVRPEMLETYGKDPFFAQLVTDPAALDFVRYNTGKPDQYVLVQQQLPSVVHTPHPH
ncbi:MAG: hypothetical protein EOO39_11845 [Cytophagaceae bacterium]|nr:MAG: hypothetical protein EOO39_11845 [Cytophagaceae bacterium]